MIFKLYYLKGGNMPTKNKKAKETNAIKVFSLGGLGVVGMNMYVVECNDEIIVMDAGILFAGGDEHGVSYIIPDFKYLKENEEKIVGLFITHGHEDHIGSLPFLLKDVKIPAIYASGIACGLIRNKFLEFPNIHYNIIEFNDDSEYRFKNFTLSFFRTNHSIPDSFGIAIKTRLGYIVNTGDFKFDFTPIGKRADYYKISKIGHSGTLCLLADSTNAMITNFSLSEKKIGQNLNDLFSQIKGRIIVATFASNVYRVQQIIAASAASGRKVIVFGHSMEKTIEVATKLKYINVPKGTILSSREYNKHKEEKVTILCTGSQGEPLAALSRIANGTHKQIKLLPNDTVIFSSKPIPGNEQFVNRNINKLVKAGARVIKNSPLSDTHTTGHASQEEIKLMFSLLCPKYFMPVHGEYAMLKSHINIANEMGVPKENCFALNAGDVLSFHENGVKVIKNGVYANDIYIDSSLSDVDSTMLKERKYLADEGFVSVIFTIDKNKVILAPTSIVTKGFVDETSNFSKEILERMKKKANSIFINLLNRYKHLNPGAIKSNFIMQMSQFIYDTTEKSPVILPIINII